MTPGRSLHPVVDEAPLVELVESTVPVFRERDEVAAAACCLE